MELARTFDPGGVRGRSASTLMLLYRLSGAGAGSDGWVLLRVLKRPRESTHGSKSLPVIYWPEMGGIEALVSFYACM